jgi:hypothetical protein
MERKNNYNDVSRFNALNNTTAKTGDRENYCALAATRPHQMRFQAYDVA